MGGRAGQRVDVSAAQSTWNRPRWLHRIQMEISAKPRGHGMDHGPAKGQRVFSFFASRLALADLMFDPFTRARYQVTAESMSYSAPSGPPRRARDPTDWEKEKRHSRTFGAVSVKCEMTRKIAMSWEETQDQDRRPCPCEYPLAPAAFPLPAERMRACYSRFGSERDKGPRGNVAADHVDIGGRMKG